MLSDVISSEGEPSLSDESSSEGEHDQTVVIDQSDYDRRLAQAAGKSCNYDGTRLIDEVLQLFLEGSLIDGRDEFGDTALCNAVIKGHAEIVGALLQCNASPNLRCTSGDTPLTYAIQFGHRDIVEALLEGRAFVELRCRSKTALTYAVDSETGQHIRGVDLLLSYRASVNVTDSQGLTPLMVAVQHGAWYGPSGGGGLCDISRNCVRELLDAGSSCNLRVNGQTAKDLATPKNRKVLELFEQDRMILLTLHAGLADQNGIFAFTCTNLGGDELVSGSAEIRQPVASLYLTIASELQSGCFQLVFPNGQLLDNDEQILCDALPACTAKDQTTS